MFKTFFEPPSGKLDSSSTLTKKLNSNNVPESFSRVKPINQEYCFPDIISFSNINIIASPLFTPAKYQVNIILKLSLILRAAL